MNRPLHMLRAALAALLTVFFGFGFHTAEAARLDDHQLKSQVAQFDLFCLAQVRSLPGPSKIYNPPELCSCAHKSVTIGLKTSEFDLPASLPASDQQKISQIERQSLWTCAQPVYVKAMKTGVHDDCMYHIRETPSAKALNDNQVEELCTCMGEQFSHADPTLLGQPDQTRVQAFADATLQNAFTSCKAQVQQ